MTTFYDEMRQTAIELIAEFGTQGLMIRDERVGTIDPVVTPVEYDCIFVKLAYSQFITDNSGSIRQGDKLFYISVKDLDIEPLPGDTIDGFRLLTVDKLQPASTTLMYEAQGRR